MENSIDRILKLINENNEVPAHVLKNIGINASALTGWKNGKGHPSTDAIIKFAKYYNVTTDYLLLGTPQHESEENSTVQKQLNNILNQLDEGDKRECLGFAKGLLRKKTNKE